jgi:hypothetical protein
MTIGRGRLRECRDAGVSALHGHHLGYSPISLGYLPF